MKRATLLMNAVLVAAILAVPAGLKAADNPQKPNIIFIVVDDLPYYGLGIYGGRVESKTPNIDKLAETGVQFTHCYSRSWCAPSRACLNTGKYRTRKANESHPFVSDILRQAGYRTCMSGKWMIQGYQEDPRTHGFDEMLLWVCDGNGNYYNYWNPQIVVFDSKGYLKEYNQPPDAPKISEWKTPIGPGPGKSLLMENTYGPDIMNRFALDFIRRNKNDPFYLYYAMKLIHVQVTRTPDSEHTAKDWHGYEWDMLNYMDKLVGKVVAELDELGLRENTMIVFIGDNGGRWSGRKPKEGFVHLPGKKGETLEGSYRVPLIVHWPAGAKPGLKCDDLVDFVDFLPTFVEAAGGKLPEKEVFDGISFLPQIKGETGTPREWVFNGESERKSWARSHSYKLYRDGRLYATSDVEEKSPITAGQGTPEAETERTRLQSILQKYPPLTKDAPKAGEPEGL